MREPPYSRGGPRYKNRRTPDDTRTTVPAPVRYTRTGTGIRYGTGTYNSSEAIESSAILLSQGREHSISIHIHRLTAHPSAITLRPTIPQLAFSALSRRDTSKSFSVSHFVFCPLDGILDIVLVSDFIYIFLRDCILE